MSHFDSAPGPFDEDSNQDQYQYQSKQIVDSDSDSDGSVSFDEDNFIPNNNHVQPKFPELAKMTDT